MYFNQQRFVHKKSKQKFHTIYKHISERCVYKVILHTFSLFAAIHLFISSHDEIEDFCSMDKKTGRRYVLRTKIIHHHKFIAKRTANKKRTKSCTFLLSSLFNIRTSKSSSANFFYVADSYKCIAIDFIYYAF